MHVEISRVPFGVDGKSQQLVNLYHFHTTDNQLVASVTDYGATVVSLHTAEPHEAGDVSTDVILGFKDFNNLSLSACYFGSTVGRCCGRIPEGKALLPDGSINCTLTCNDGANHLHGGRLGFHTRVWDASVLSEGTVNEFQDAWWWRGAQDEALYARSPVLVLEMFSPDGEEGYPGNLHVAALFTVERRNEGATWVSILNVEYRAKLDEADAKPTIVNLTNHAYFNLDPAMYGGGALIPTVPETHTLQLFAEAFFPATATLLHAGEAAHVSTDTAFDFRSPKLIAHDISAASPQLAVGGGYDHTYLLNDCGNASLLHPCAQLTHEASGRTLSVSTTQPAVHFYSGNFIKPGRVQLPLAEYVHFATMQRRSGVCFETQRVNSNLPSIVLSPGELLVEVTRFEVRSPASIESPASSMNYSAVDVAKFDISSLEQVATH